MHPEGTVERVSELLAKKKHETMPKVECSGTNLSEIWHYLVVLVAKSCEPSGDTTPRKVTAVILHGVVSPETPLYDGSSGGRAPLGRSKHTLTSCASQASLARHRVRVRLHWREQGPAARERQARTLSIQPRVG